MVVEKKYNMGTMTKAGKIGMIRNALRKLTMVWKPITETRKRARVSRGKYLCAGCGNIVDTKVTVKLKNGKIKKVNNLIVDHIVPIVDPLIGFNGWDDWINKAFDEDINNFQLLCRECNINKTYDTENKLRLFLNEADIEGEDWVNMNGLEGFYLISNMGRIKSINYNGSGKAKLLKLDYNKDYVRIHLKGKRFLVHRLVAENFLDKIEGKDIVNHIDGNKKNNIVSNLEYVTSSENSLHAVKSIHIKGVIQLTKDGKELNRFKSITDAIFSIKGNNIGTTHITRACKGIQKTAYGYKWKYI